MTRIGFLGKGEIASAMVETIAGDGHALFVSERNATRSAALDERFDAVTRASNAVVVAESEIVILCLLANTARQALPSLPFREEQVVVSVMADMPLERLAALCAPARDILRALPLPVLPLGDTPLVSFPESPACNALFDSHARLHHCTSEDALEAHFAATALLLPMLDQIETGAAWLAGISGDKPAAKAYLAALIGGYSTMLRTRPALDLEILPASLSTEGGLNETMSRVLRDNGTHDAPRAGLDGLRARLGTRPGDGS